MPLAAPPKDADAHSPPPEGRRGGLSRTGGPTPKADAFCPSLEGIFRGAPHASLAGATEHENE